MPALAYLITFRTHGTWLHGEEGSVDRHHRNFGAPFVPVSEARRMRNEALLKETPFSLSRVARAKVRDALMLTATARHWHLYAAHVRTTHVHLVIAGVDGPKRTLASLKSKSSVALAETSRRKIWAEGGSTKYLWTEVSLKAAQQYVLDEQGEQMEIYQNRNLR